MLICPICKNKLQKIDNTYKCQNNHSFDISKKGYTNLLISHPNAGDNKEMVEARFNFLERGYYQKLKDKINSIVNDYKPSVLVDLGCGTGYYTNNLNVNVLGFDISKDAINKASINKQNNYFVSSSNNIPLEGNSIDFILTVFAPSFEEEIIRLLKDDGIFLLVTPAQNHLYELKETIYNNPYLNSEKDQDFKTLKLVKKEEIKYKTLIKYDDIFNLLKMTPYFYKTNKEDLLKITSDLLVTIHFNVSVYKK